MNICSVDGCEKQHLARGMCNGHYLKWRKDNIKPKSICKVNECNGTLEGHGYCKKHNRRFKKHGNPLAGGTYKGWPAEWILDNLDYSGDECLRWPFNKGARGYPCITIDGYAEKAHVVITTIIYGPKPNRGDHSRHLCGHKWCMNPLHLAWGSASQNSRDRLTHGTDNRGEKHPLSKLTRVNVINIVDRLKRGHTAKEIATEYEVVPQTILEIKWGNSWGWLTGIKSNV